MTTGRFDVFSIGELQALVFAFASAGAYDQSPRMFGHPVWRGLAREAETALEVAVDHADAWDARVGALRTTVAPATAPEPTEEADDPDAAPVAPAPDTTSTEEQR